MREEVSLVDAFAVATSGPPKYSSEGLGSEKTTVPHQSGNSSVGNSADRNSSNHP